jgi:hypothetical protein
MKGLALILICFLAFAVAVEAQTVSTSLIKGTVRDPSGAAVPGATVVVTQTATGLVRTTLSSSDGSYVFPELPTGPYRLEVTVPGFSKYVQTGIVLQVATNPTIEVTLKVGNISEQVTVEANATMVESQNTGVGSLIDSQRVVELPLIGRQVTDLIVLSGAASSGSDPFMLSGNRFYPSTQQFSVAGGLAMGSSYVLDGAGHNDFYNNAGLPLPFPDALQEFKVETSALPAQYGMHSGAAVNAVTKSGTNEWHGSAFWFVRNYLFNARTFFAPTRDSLKRNQYGGSLGGPIRHNKLFLFAAYQGTATRQDPTGTVTYVPTKEMFNGDFSTVASGLCQRAPVTLRDPLNNNQPFLNNQIPVDRLSPVALNIAKRLPASSDPCGRITYGAMNIDDEQFGVSKVDYTLSAKHSLFGRYLVGHDKKPVPYDFGKNLLTTSSAGWDDLVQSIVFGDTYLFGSNAVNSFRLAVNRSAVARLGAEFFAPKDVGINMYNYLPGFTSLSVTGGFSIGMSMATNANYRTTTVQGTDDFSLVWGDHQMSFGVSLSNTRSNGYANVNAAGPMSFNGSVTGLGIADFFTGNLSGINQGGPTALLGRYWYVGLYAQDAWKLRPGLMLNYGLRWEPWFPMQFSNGQVYHFDFDAFQKGVKTSQFKNAPAGLFYPGDPGFPDKTGFYKQWKQFEPRVGIVWDPKGDGRMSVRASYGIFYDFTAVEYHLNTVAAPPWGGFVSITNPPGGLADPWAGQPGGNPFPLTIGPNAAYNPFATYAAFDYDTKSTYVQQWNLSLQRQIAKDWMFSASYLGNHMVHLYGGRELNPALVTPGATLANTNQRRKLNQMDPVNGKYFGYLDSWDYGGTGSYHGLLLSAQRRLARGFTINANYTWSHCIGNPVNSVLNSGPGGYAVYLFDGRQLDRGNCNTSATDRRHVANISAVGQMPKFSNRTMNALASGWRASATVKAGTGNYLTLSTGLDRALSGVPTNVQRPNQVLDNPYGDRSIGNYLNPLAFAQPTLGTNGNVGLGTIEGPGSLNFDFGLTRLFHIVENQTLEIRAEAQNLLNRANFGNPSTALNSNTFGQINSAGPGRVLQFALKYLF